MKFIVTRRNTDGTYDEVGMNNRFLTSQYQSMDTVWRYGIPINWKQRGVRIQALASNGKVTTTIYKSIK